MNEETKRLAEELGRKLYAKFPDVVVHGVSPSYGDPNAVLVSVTYPPDEKREMEIRWYAAQLSGEYLDQHHTLITPVSGSMPSAVK